MPELYEHLNPMPFEAAVQMELELAEDLRALLRADPETTEYLLAALAAASHTSAGLRRLRQRETR
jgi:hypothetical protein